MGIQTSMEQRFTEVYHTGEWSNNRAYPLSGRGSTLEHTAQVRQNLTHIIATLFDKENVLRIIDAPCGDMTWMPVWLNEILLDGWKIRYQGIDIVKPIVDENRAKVSITAPGLESLTFEHSDITQTPIAKADLIICKELVNHLAFTDIFRLLRNFAASKSTYVIITSNKGWDNEELNLTSPGASRHIDLLRPPFNLPPPVYEDGFLSVWKNPVID
jgi:hypothetical protein